MTETTTRPAETSAIEVPTFRHFIAGEWCDSTSVVTFESRNPADTRDIVGRFQQGTAADVAMAIKAAPPTGKMASMAAVATLPSGASRIAASGSVQR